MPINAIPDTVVFFHILKVFLVDFRMTVTLSKMHVKSTLEEKGSQPLGIENNNSDTLDLASDRLARWDRW